ncbi:MAG: FAD-binding protein [Gammaproteobacteria bacterium]
MADIARLTGRFRKLEKTQEPRRIKVRSLEQISEVLMDRGRFPSPVRPVGANSNATRCTRVHGGTVMDLSEMNKLIHLDKKSVTVQAGMRLRDLVRILADRDLELLASEEQLDRTIGGIVSSASLFCGTTIDDPNLAASVLGIGLVTPNGRTIDFDSSTPEMLNVLRQSYGLMGVIHRVSLRIRPRSQYTVRHGKLGFAELTKLLPSLATANAGVKIYLLPFRDRAFVELRETDSKARKPRVLAWRARDWLTNQLLPDLLHLLRKIPGKRFRDPLIDGFSEATQVLINRRLVDAGSNAMEQTGKFRRIGPLARTRSCTWVFPAKQFGAALYSYREYCRRHYEVAGFRCDLPALAYRLLPDPWSLLSPSFEGPVFALSLRTTVTDGWEDFLIDFGAIAGRFGGIPLLNYTRGVPTGHVKQAYGSRLEKFCQLREQIDPQNRLLNQFFTEHLG